MTRAECAQISGQLQEDSKIIKRALVGDDLLGGLVKEVADIKRSLDDKKKGDALSRRARLAIIVAFIPGACAIAVELIKAAAGH